MENTNRCKYCGDSPVPYGWGSGAWSYVCNCIFWQSNQTVEYWSTEEAAIKHWNKFSGIGGEPEAKKVDDLTPPECKCQTWDLLWYGCRCNYAEWKKNKNKA